MPDTRKSRPTYAQPTDRALTRYRAKRDFGITAEPRGNKRPGLSRDARTALPFVIQKHAASRLHYDFRLAWDGVLKSWAVAKGPSYYPGDKRLAVQVEDHPLEYGDFEGTIPKGQYGGGTVMVWDTGEWTPLGDAARGLKDGHLKFELHGKKLKGTWALVRMHGKAGGTDKANWLLIKEKDRFAREAAKTPVTEEAPNSVSSGRTMEEIARSNDRVWNSSRKGATPDEKPQIKKPPPKESAEPKRRKSNAPLNINVSGAPRERFPGFIAPQLAQPTTTAPSGDEWTHELKLDGYRIQILIEPSTKKNSKAGRVQLLTRKGLDWASRMPDIAEAAGELRVESAILDGEAVALDDRGVSDFAALQAAFHEGRQSYITYFAFDLLHLNGHNLRGLPLSKRKELLAHLLADAQSDGPLKLSDDLDADGKEVFQKACALGAEGIISKLASGEYISGRGNTWLKLKCYLEQEFVIGGFTLPTNGGIGVGALLLGYYDGGRLIYAGRSGTGFTQQTHRSLRAQLDRIARRECPFADVPGEARRGAHWVQPTLVAQISFSTWTRDKLVRQAAFKGLREDKPAKDVVREVASTPKAAKSSATHRRNGAVAHRQSRKKGQEVSVMPSITHPDKVLDQESGMTKQDLADYYVAVAQHMLPHIADRPLSVVRCPEGNSKPCFFQKHIGLGLPDGVKSVSIRSRKRDETDDYLTVDSPEGLAGLAQMGVLEIHAWGSHNESLETPDRIVFDLDPDTAIQWKTLGETATELRRRLNKLGLESFLKATGGKGLHVVVPVEPEHAWPVIKDFAHRLVLKMEAEKPDLYVTKMSKASRKNRIYLDYLRNDREATSVAPLSPRARSGSPVSMPLRWSDLDSARAPVYHVSDLAKWKSRLQRDPWQKLSTVRQRLTDAMLRDVGVSK